VVSASNFSAMLLAERTLGGADKQPQTIHALSPQTCADLLASQCGSLGPRLGLSFRYGFSKEVFLTEEAEVMAGLEGATRWLAKSVTKLSARLTEAMALGVAYTVTSDSAPAPGKEKVDTGLTALLEVGF
jgi:hypothetical protein